MRFHGVLFISRSESCSSCKAILKPEIRDITCPSIHSRQIPALCYFITSAGLMIVCVDMQKTEQQSTGNAPFFACAMENLP